MEIFGSSSALSDVEVMSLLYQFLQKLGLKDLQVLLNTLGDMECRKAYRHQLVEFLKPKKEQLSDDSKTRLEKNPLRILDSKDPKDQELLSGAPKLHQFLSKESRVHFEKVQAYLQKANIPFTVEEKLVRGLDYYTETVFEVVTKDLGAAKHARCRWQV